MDTALTAKNSEHVDLMRLKTGLNVWWDFTSFFNDYCIDIPPAPFIFNHIYIFGADNTKTPYSRQTYKDCDYTAKNLIPITRSKRQSKNLTVPQRGDKFKNMYANLDAIPPPGMSNQVV